MTPEQIKPGVPVTYYVMIKKDGKKDYPIETEITDGPFVLEHGGIVCKVKNKIGVVSIKHLEPREIKAEEINKELLEALKNARTKIKNLLTRGLEENEANEVWKVFAELPTMMKINAAIAKAEGKEVAHEQT